MITSIGGSVHSTTSTLCCSICSPLDSSSTLSSLLLERPVPRKKRHVAVRKVDQSLLFELKKKLDEERKMYISENPSMAILGLQFVCSDNAIDKICSNAKYISKIEDTD